MRLDRDEACAAIRENVGTRSGQSHDPMRNRGRSPDPTWLLLDVPLAGVESGGIRAHGLFSRRALPRRMFFFLNRAGYTLCVCYGASDIRTVLASCRGETIGSGNG